MKHFLLLLASLFCIGTSFVSAEEEDPLCIPFKQAPQTGKRIPSHYMSYLTYSNGEACFHTTQPYSYATIAVTDQSEMVIESITVSPDNNCDYLNLQHGCIITCTFDNGQTIFATY